MLKAHLILYVADQERSMRFYSKVLALMPILHVPGMTEFTLAGGAVLGLMPERGICRLLGDRLPNPALARGIPRAEVYLVVDDPHSYHARAVAEGAQELSLVCMRDWGHQVGYLLDLDGHVLAFAGVV